MDEQTDGWTHTHTQIDGQMNKQTQGSHTD